MITVLSIDPGITGALAWLTLDPQSKAITLLGLQDVPTATVKSGKTLKSFVVPALLAHAMSNPIFPRPTTAVIEDVHAMPGQGVTSMFRFGHVAGLLAGVAAGLRYPIAHMRTNEWQPLAGVRKGSPDAGRLRVTELFPEQAQLFARVKDHNRADAVLIGYAYLKKEFL